MYSPFRSLPETSSTSPEKVGSPEGPWTITREAAGSTPAASSVSVSVKPTVLDCAAVSIEVGEIANAVSAGAAPSQFPAKVLTPEPPSHSFAPPPPSSRSSPAPPKIESSSSAPNRRSLPFSPEI